MTITIEEMKKQLDAQNAQIAELKKAQDMAISTNAPTSMQVTYTPGLQSKVFENAPFFRYLESKGRVGAVSTTEVAFYKEKAEKSFTAWIKEDADIPDAMATKYDEETERMKTILFPIDIGIMAQMGNQTIDLMAREMEKGYIKIANEKDKSLLEGKGISNDSTESNNTYDIKGLTETIPSQNKVDLSTGDSGILTESAIEDMLIQLIDGNASNVDCIVTSYGVGKILKQLVAPYRRYNDKIDINLGHRVIGYESITGAEIPILIDSNLSTTKPGTTEGSTVDDNKMLFVDTSSIEVKELLAPTVFQNLPTNKLGQRNAIVNFVTAQNIASFRDGMISGIDIEASIEAIGGDAGNSGSN